MRRVVTAWGWGVDMKIDILLLIMTGILAVVVYSVIGVDYDNKTYNRDNNIIYERKCLEYANGECTVMIEYKIKGE